MTNTQHSQQAIIKIHNVLAPKLPAIDDAFAKKLGVETVAELRAQIRQHMEQELNKTLKNKLKTQLIEELIKRNSLELPKALIEREQQHLEKEWQERLIQETRLPDVVLPPEVKEKSLEMARRRVTLSLLFAEIIKKNNIQVDASRVYEEIHRIANSFQQSQEIINMIQKQPAILNSIRAQVMEEQVVEKLLEQVQYTEKTAQYSDVMQLSVPSGRDGSYHIHTHDEHDTHEHRG